MSSQDSGTSEAQLLKELEGLHSRCAELERLASVHQEERKKLIRLNRFLKAIRQCNEALLHAPSEMDLMQEICRIIVEVGGYRLAWVGFAGHDGAKTVRPVAVAGFDDGYLQSLNISWADNELGQGPTGTAIRTGAPVVITNLLTDPAFRPWREPALQRGYQSSLAIPLMSEGEAFGSLNVYAAEPDAFNEEELKVLKELADDLAFGIMALRTQGERRQAIAAAEAARLERTRIFQAIGNPSLVLDENQKVIAANQAMTAAAGQAEAELIGRTCHSIFDSQAPEDCPYQQALSGKPAQVKERVLEVLGGTFLVACTPELDRQGELRRVIVIATDLTEYQLMSDALRQAEAKYHSIVENCVEGIFQTTLEGRYLSANPALARMLGYASPQELMARITNIAQQLYVDPHRRDEFQRLMAEQGEARGFEFQAYRKDGSVIWISVNARAARDEQGAFLYYEGIYEDITQRKRDEEEIRRLNRLYNFLSQVNQTLIRAQSRDKFLQEICRIAVDVGGFPLAWIGWHDPETHRVNPIAWAGNHEDYMRQIRISSEKGLQDRDPTARAVREEKPSICEDILAGSPTLAGRESSGREGLRVSASFPFRLGGRVCGVLCLYAAEATFFQEKEIALLEEVALDISFGLDRLEEETQRRRTEEALGKSEERFRLLAENAQDVIFSYRLCPPPGFDYLSPSVTAITGYTPEEHYAQPQLWLKSVHPEDRALFEAALNSPDQFTQPFIFRFLRKNGTLVWIEQRNVPIPDASGQLAAVEGIARDITERIQVKNELITAAEEWRITFDTIPDLILLTDRQHRILRVNQAFAQALGLSYPKILGKPFYQVLDGSETLPDDHPLRQTLADRKEHSAERYHPKLARHFLITTTPLLDESGVMTGAVHVMRDISERIQMELQTVQTEKLASLGVMAGGVAHEINNPIGGILGIAQLLLMDYPDHGTLTEDLKHIEGAAVHCSEIVKNLLTFSRKSGVSAREPVTIPALADQILKLIGHQFIYHNIQVRQEFTPDFPVLLVNRTQLQQVLINLLINAQQAMPKKGEVFIRGRTLPSREAVIEIEDQGGGIPAAIRDRIFDPFFTTKEQGQGTGLGLSVSYRIIQEHGGRIEVESEEGKGTCMRLVFPPELVTAEKVTAEQEAED